MRRLARLFAETLITYRNNGVKAGDRVRPEELLVDVDELLKHKPASTDEMLYIKQKLPYTDRCGRNEGESIKDFVDRALLHTLERYKDAIYEKHSHRQAHVNLLLKIYQFLIQLDKAAIQEAKVLCQYRAEGKLRDYIEFYDSLKNRNSDLQKDLGAVLEALFDINHRNVEREVTFDGQSSSLATTGVYRFGVYTGVSKLGECLREQLLRPLKLTGDLKDDLTYKVNEALKPYFSDIETRLKTQEELQWVRDFKGEASGPYKEDEAWEAAIVKERQELTAQRALVERARKGDTHERQAGSKSSLNGISLW